MPHNLAGFILLTCIVSTVVVLTAAAWWVLYLIPERKPAPLPKATAFDWWLFRNFFYILLILAGSIGLYLIGGFSSVVECLVGLVLYYVASALYRAHRESIRQDLRDEIERARHR